MKKLVERVWEYSLKNPEGFTLDLETLEAITSGLSVAYKETQNSHGRESLEKVIQHALAHDKIVGGWLFEGRYYFDSVRVFPPEQVRQALEFAKEHEQIGYFDLDNKLTRII